MAINTDNGALPHMIIEPDDELAIELEPQAAADVPFVSRPDPSRLAVERVGDPARTHTAIYLDVSALEVMFADALHHADVETGGLLAGRTYRDGIGRYLTVSAAIPARQAERSRTSVTFTHETWADMLTRREADHPDAQVVGWYHTHPGMRVFLSAQDQFIHRSFFAGPEDIAVVLDLQRREWGIFCWQGDSLSICEGFFIFSGNADRSPRIPQVLQTFVHPGAGRSQ